MKRNTSFRELFLPVLDVKTEVERLLMIFRYKPMFRGCPKVLDENIPFMWLNIGLSGKKKYRTNNFHT